MALSMKHADIVTADEIADARRWLLDLILQLDATATYVVTDMEKPEAHVTVSAKGLMEGGLTVAMAAAPEATVIVYRKKTGKAGR